MTLQRMDKISVSASEKCPFRGGRTENPHAAEDARRKNDASTNGRLCCFRIRKVLFLDSDARKTCMEQRVETARKGPKGMDPQALAAFEKCFFLDSNARKTCMEQRVETARKAA